MEDASPPCFVLDLSKAKGGQPDFFLMGYKQEGGSLDDLALVSGSAVYSTCGILRGDDVGLGKGLKQHVHKPASKKMLTAEVHLGKVIAALKAVAAASSAVASEAASKATSAAASSAGVGSGTGGGGGGAGATLEIETSDKFAVLIVKEALRIGSVVLATVKLPAVEETRGDGGGTGVPLLLRKLLLGSVRETHRSAREAEVMRRDRARAREEHLKVQRLLDSVIRDKRKTVTKILEGATLVINAKKVRIEHLEDEIQRLEEGGGSGGSEDESDDGEASRYALDAAVEDDDGGGNLGGGGGGDVGGNADNEDGRPPSTTGGKTGKAKGKGKGKGSGGGDNPREDAATGGGRGRPGSSSRVDAGGASGTRVEGKVKVKMEQTSLVGAGGGALAAPFGTQEVSGQDLLQIVDAKVKSEAREIGPEKVHPGHSHEGKNGRSDVGGSGVGGSTRKRPRQQGSSPLKWASILDESNDDNDDGSGSAGSGSGYDGAGRAKKYLADTDSSDSDSASTPQKSRRRRLKRELPASAACGEQASGGGVAASKSAGTAGASAGSSASRGDAPPKTGFSWMAMAATDSSEEDLSGMK